MTTTTHNNDYNNDDDDGCAWSRSSMVRILAMRSSVSAHWKMLSHFF
jgi:hypothetical protein